jgi:transposase-like protein
LTPLEVVVLIVADDRAVVEADLAAGRLLCPRCRVGVLGGWGCARLREVRTREGVRRLRPRRGRCRGQDCRSTHVLLPAVCLARRKHVAEVIGAALVARVAGLGYRSIAGRLGVARDTVRGWLGRFVVRREAIRAQFTRWAVALDAQLGPIVPAGSVLGDVLEAIAIAARSWVLRFGPRPVWEIVSFLSGGALLSNTSEHFPPVR